VGVFGHRRDLRLWQAELGGAGSWPESDQPKRPPIQQVAADLRRLRRQLDRLPKGASYVRVAGVQRAYDEVLVIACAELEVDTTLSETPAGQQRDLERLRVEFMLGECGLFL
jgi:predicted NAD/FAD-binding protein